jgi:hypothetical protein
MRFLRLGLGAATVPLAFACSDIDTTRNAPPLGTIGQEVFGVFCDRVASLALPEDLQGDSYRNVCHQQNGQWASSVDTTLLPPITDGAVDQNGNPVSAATQQAARTYAVNRIGAMARDRDELIGAIDATIPVVMVPVKDTHNPDVYQSCGVPMTTPDQVSLGAALADMLGRFGPLYDDGTMPRSTESLATLMQTLETATDAQSAFARLASRIGYRPPLTTLGATRPSMSYTQLRALANATLSIISPDSAPYDVNGPHDAYGNHVPVPGPANPQLNQVTATFQQELRTATISAALAPLATTQDALTGRAILSRPRSNLEALGVVMMAQNPLFGAGMSNYIVQRDARGIAVVPLVNGQLPSPFVDLDHDGLPDVDMLGQFVSSTGMAPPSPFFAVDAPTQAPAFDMFQRSLVGNQLLYGYVDTTHTFTAATLADLSPLLNPDPTQNHESLMYMLGGAYDLLGSRDASTSLTQIVYGDPTSGQVTISYNAFHPENSPLVDLIYAVLQVVGDPSTDDALALTSSLMQNHQGDMARIIGAGLAFKDVANKHTEATIPAKSTFWDEVLDVMVQVEQEPGLMVDVLRATEAPTSGLLGNVLANFMHFDDHISYDRMNLNGPPFNETTMDHSELVTAVDRTMPDTGWNRSAFQKFIQLLHDTNGVTACNKNGAVLHGKGVPLVGSADFCSGFPYFCSLGASPFQECEVFKIDNLAKFYIDSMVGKASLYLRPDYLRNGVAGIGAATVDMMQQSSGITGFWDPPSSNTLRPQPQFLSRQVYFDIDNDSPNPGGTNYTTNHFLADLMGDKTVGTLACPEVVIPDPDPSAPDASPDGMVHGLRNCPAGLDVFTKDPDALFVLEDFSAFASFAPLIQAFANHGREDLYLDLLETVFRHWADAKDTADCTSMGSVTTNPEYCAQDGAVTYEPLFVEAFPGDIFPALSAVTTDTDTTNVAHCTAGNPTTGACTATSPLSGVSVLTSSIIALIDPNHAKTSSLTDRHGGTTALRNDGTTNPQVTPVYLVTQALDNIDAALAMDPPRMANWRLGRSQLVDQFLSIMGTTTASAFADPAIPNITPTLVSMLRSQMAAQCPSTYVPPGSRCTWARDNLTNNISTTIGGPLFSTTMDLVEALRANDGARTGLEALLQYLVNAASQNDALAAMLATANDLIQVLGDDQNLVPVYQALAPSLAPSTKDGAGHILTANLIDAQLTLLSRISGQFMSNGTEICADEADPNQILSQILTRLVTPMTDSTGRATETPLEVLIDVIADVNRADPSQTSKLQPPDYGAIATEVQEFLMDPQFGLEQFYEIVRKGTE